MKLQIRMRPVKPKDWQSSFYLSFYPAVLDSTRGPRMKGDIDYLKVVQENSKDPNGKGSETHVLSETPENEEG